MPNQECAIFACLIGIYPLLFRGWAMLLGQK